MKDIRKYTDKVLNLAIIVLFIIMFGVTTLNVILRYIFNSPLSFSVELGRYTFCAIVYLGSILVMREDGHIGLDIIVDALPEKIGKVVRAISRILVLIYLVIFCTMSVRMVMGNWTNRSSTMHIPMSLVYIFMVIGSAGMFIEELLNLLGVNKNDGNKDISEVGGGL